MELIRFVHVLGIVATFLFHDAQIITWCVALTIPYSLYRAVNQPIDVSRVVVTVIFLGCAIALVAKTMPSGLTSATMLTALALIVLSDPAQQGPRLKIATTALLFLSGYAVIGLVLMNESVDTIFLHSKNYLSVLGLLFFFAAQSEWETSGLRPPLWLSVPAIGLCLLSLSVGGLLGASGLTVYLLARRFGTAKVLGGVVAIVTTSILATSLFPLTGQIQQMSSLIPTQGSWGVLLVGLADRVSALMAGEGGGDRLQIWSSYINQLDAVSFWAGLPLKGLLTQSLHNSYLAMHSHFGALALALLVAWIIMIVRAHLSALMLVLLVLLAIRAFVDSILFTGGYFDGLLLLSLRLYEQEPQRARGWSNTAQSAS